MLHEISRKQINVYKHEDSTLSWNNFVLGVSGNKNLHLIDFTYNLHSLQKEIDIRELSVSASYESPVPTNFLSNYATRGIKNLELVEMITNPAFWPHHKMLSQEMTNIVGFKWSPENIIDNHKCILATINSVGSVEFFTLNNQTWTSIMNFSAEMKKHLTLTTEMLDKCPKEFEEMKHIVYCLETSIICWAPELNDDKSCYLTTIQKSGEIFFWLLKCHNNTLQTQFCNSIKNSNKFEVSSAIWIPLDKDKFLFIISNECGQMIANEFEIANNNIKLHRELNIWSHKDKMIVTYLDYIFHDNKLLIFFYKNRHLIIQMYDKTMKLICQCVKNVNDHKITSITRSKNEFYVCTINTKIYKIHYNIINDAIEVDLNMIELKESYPSCDLLGLAFTVNNALCVLGLFDRRLIIRKQPVKIDIVYLCLEIDIETNATAILSNPSKKIINVWDHIELLRCKVIRSKKLPELDYNVLMNEGEFDVYKMKVYLIFLILYHSLEKIMTPFLKGRLPETSIQVIKERILLFQCVKIINKLYAKYESNVPLSDFEKQTFECSKRFLFYFCKTYSKRSKDYIDDSKLNVPCGHIEHTCQGCDEIITDYSCKNGHLNMFCSLTLTPIEENDYLVCKCCSSTARIELHDQNPICIFCDMSFNKNF